MKTLKLAPGVRFDPELHKYTNVATGEYIPGVTSLLKKYGWIDTRFYTVAGRDRGTSIHDFTVHIEEGKITSEDYRLTDYYPYLCAYEKFLVDFKWQSEYMEEPLHNEQLDYCGILDRAGKGHKQRILLDIKTGGKSNWHGLQLAAYADPHFKKYDRRVLRLKPNGDYTLDSRGHLGNFSDPIWDEAWRNIALADFYTRANARVVK
jgi:hypothetical protein